MKKGAGRAQRYMTGKMPTNAKNSSRKEQAKSSTKPAPSASAPINTAAMTEEQRMALMFQQSSEQWTNQLDEMSK
jgi:protein MPE1